MKNGAVVLSLLFAFAAAANAASDVGTTLLVKDLEPSVTEPFMGIPIFRPLEVGSAVYFFQDDGIHGIELWRSDGTAAGTGMVVDLCPGRCDAVGEDALRGIAALGSTVLFAGSDGAHGVELWATDGTLGGTHLVKDIQLGADSSDPRFLRSAGGDLYFTADDGVHGRELWRSDGTESGTVLFAELVPGSTGSEIEFVEAAPGFIYAGAYGSPFGGLWRCDGTPGGTLQLTPTPVAASTLLRTRAFLVLPDGRLLFSGQESPHDRLWISDGTVAGTHHFMAPDLGPADPYSFFLLNGLLHFVARASSGDGAERLWKTNGTAAGTVEIPIPAGVDLWTSLDRLAVVGTRAILVAADSSHGAEPWVLENDSLTLLRDVYPGSESSIRFGNYLDVFVAEAADRVFFFADDAVHGFEVWSTDGTSAGTQRVTDLPATGSTWPFDDATYITQRSRYLGPLFFRVTDPLLGQHLWKSDGTVAGTMEVATLSAQRSSILPTWRRSLYAPRESACAEAASDRLLFSTYRWSTRRAELWGTDGSDSGTVLLSTLVDSQGQATEPACSSRGASALFYGPAGSSWALFKTDGTVPGTSMLLPDVLVPGYFLQASQPTFVDLGTRHVGTFGGNLLRTEGTSAGSGAEAWGDLWRIASSAGSLWGTDTDRLVRSDGTAAGTQILFDGGSDPQPDIRDISPLGEGVLFLATQASSGGELWRSDGTMAGTAMVVDLLPGAASAAHPLDWVMSFQESSLNRRLRSLDSFAIASLDDGIHGTELWRTDGTAAGTVLLKDIYPGSYPSTPRDLMRVGDAVYFTAEDELHGLELWVTDGTVDGTHLVRDLVPGAEWSVPQELTEVRGRLYFTAWRPSWGREAFQSDGTEAGTLQVADVWPGTGSSSPSRFAAVRDTLYFAANDGEHGFELFKVIDSTLLDVFADGFEGGSLGAWSRSLAP